MSFERNYDTAEAEGGAGGPPEGAARAGPRSTINNLLKAIHTMGRGNDPEQILKELKFHQEATQNFQETMANSVTPIAFGFVKAYNPYVQVMHSIGTCVGDPLNQTEYHNRNVGFVGDRTEEAEPVAVEAYDRYFEWGDHIISKDNIAMATFFGAEENAGNFYTMPTGDEVETDTVRVPKMIMIPSGLIAWLLSTPRTPHDLINKIFQVLPDGQDGLAGDPPDVALPIIHWGMVASCKDTTRSDDKTSVLAIHPDPVVTMDPNTHRWLAKRLETTLGPKSQPAQPAITFIPPPPGPPPATYATNTGTTAKKGYSARQLSALAGWCVVLITLKTFPRCGPSSRRMLATWKNVAKSCKEECKQWPTVKGWKSARCTSQTILSRTRLPSRWRRVAG